MPMDNICNYYYKEAISCAKNDDISGALLSIKKLPKDCYMNNETKKLTALCLLRLGYYSLAYKYAIDLSEYEETFKRLYINYEEYFPKFSEKLKAKDYKGALEIMLKHSNGSVLEYNMAGCLYALSKDVKKARLSFRKALEMDIYNETTICLILNLKEEERVSFFSFLKNLFNR